MPGVSLDQQYTDQHILIYATPARPDKLASVAVECLLLLLFKSQHKATQMDGIDFLSSAPSPTKIITHKCILH